MNRTIISLVHFSFLVFIHGGCAQPLYWAKPNANAGEFEQDVTECRRRLGLPDTETFKVSGLTASIGTDSVPMDQCLAEKGWFLARKPKD